MTATSACERERALLAPAVCKEFGTGTTTTTTTTTTGRDAGPGCHAGNAADVASAHKTTPISVAAQQHRRSRLRAIRRPRRLCPLRILAGLPTELQLQVLSHVPPPAVTLLALPESPLHPLVLDLQNAHATHLFQQTLDNQFAAEAAVFPRTDPSHTLSLWTSPDGIPWALYSRSEYLATLHRIQQLTSLATDAVQAAMPLMAQRHMVYTSLLYCWKLLRYSPGDAQRGVWRWFAALPKTTQAEIDNFFNNLVGAFLDAQPVQWPTDCGCMHVRERLGALGPGSWERCRYRVPERLAAEMEGCGVAELAGKQMLLRSVGRLLGFVWNHGRALGADDEARARRWFANEDWGGAAVLSHKCAHLPYAPLVVGLREDAYEVWAYGRRGEGRVELRCRQWRDDVCRMLETAVSLPPGEPLELDWFEHEQDVGAVPSFVVDRACWWSWWWWDCVGLERLFAGAE